MLCYDTVLTGDRWNTLGNIANFQRSGCLGIRGVEVAIKAALLEECINALLVPAFRNASCRPTRALRLGELIAS